MHGKEAAMDQLEPSVVGREREDGHSEEMIGSWASGDGNGGSIRGKEAATTSKTDFKMSLTSLTLRTTGGFNCISNGHCMLLYSHTSSHNGSVEANWFSIAVSAI